MPRFVIIFKVEDGPSATIVHMYLNASYGAEKLLDGVDRLSFLHDAARQQEVTLPIGQPATWSVTRVPTAMNPAYMLGETMLVRIIWKRAPNTGEARAV